MSCRIARSALPLLSILFAAVVLPAHAGEVESRAGSEADANKAVVRQLFDEVLNQGRLEVADELVADGDGFGPEWFRTTYRMRRTAFPDLTYRIEEMIAEGDRVMVRFTAVGTPNGPSVPVPEEKTVEVSGVAILGFEDGRVTTGWELTDMLKLVRETGYTLQAPQAANANG